MASVVPVSSGSSSKSAVDDPLSPYFLHHSDSPGLVLVSQQLTGENYASWSRAMLIALSVKNKTGFVDGSILRPDGTDLGLLNAWIRNNNIVISWILNSVSKDISASILFSDSAFDIWLDLRDRFQQSNGPRIFQLRRELINHTQNQQSVSVYFTKLKALWEELNNFRPVCSCGKCSCEGVKNLNSYFQMEYVMSFLMGLNDSFAQIRAQLLLFDPLPPINKVFSLVSQEERQRSVSSSISSGGVDTAHGLAFAVKADGNKRTESQFSTPYKGPRKERPFCTHCNTPGHTIEKCYKLHGYPPGYKQRQRPQSVPVNQVSTPATHDEQCKDSGSIGVFMNTLNTDQYQQLMTMLSNHLVSSNPTSDTQPTSSTSYAAGICSFAPVTSKFPSSHLWLIDSGASRHICSHAHMFLFLKPIWNSTITLPNNTSFPVHLCGDIQLDPHFLLKDVLFVP